MLRYPVILTDDDNGTILATCPDLPEAATFGEDRDDALLRAIDAIETAIQGRIADREPVPLPSALGETVVKLPMQATLKVSSIVRCASASCARPRSPGD